MAESISLPTWGDDAPVEARDDIFPQTVIYDGPTEPEPVAPEPVAPAPEPEPVAAEPSRVSSFTRENNYGLQDAVNKFSGVDTMSAAFKPEHWARIQEGLKYSQQPEKDLKRYAVIDYAAKAGELSAEELAADWDVHRDQFAKHLFPDDPKVGKMTDDDLYAKIGEQVNQDFHGAQLVEAVHQAGLNAGIGGLVEGNDLDNTTPWLEFKKTLESAEGYDPAMNDDYLEIFRASRKQVIDTQLEASETAKELLPIFKQMSSTEGIKDYTEAFDSIMPVFEKMDDDEIAQAAFYIGRMAAQDDQDHSYREGLDKAFEQGLVDFFTAPARRFADMEANRILTADELMIPDNAGGSTPSEFYRSVVDQAGGESTPLGVSAGRPMRPATPAELEELKAGAARVQRRSKIGRTIIKALHGEVDPVIDDNIFERATYGTAGMAPMLATGAVGGMGLSLATGYGFVASAIGAGLMTQPGIAGQRYEEFLDMGMTVEQSGDLSFISSIIESGIEGLQWATLGGGGPWIKKLTSRLAMNNIIGRYLTKTAGISVAENAQEFVQDLTPMVLAEAAEALTEVYPDHDWSESFKGLLNTRADVALSLLPLAVFGAVGGTMNEQKQNYISKQLSVNNMMMLGLDRDKAEAVMGERNLLARGKAYRAALREQNENAAPDDLNALDAEYLAAVEANDMEKAQTLATAAAGYAVDSAEKIDATDPRDGVESVETHTKGDNTVPAVVYEDGKPVPLSERFEWEEGVDTFVQATAHQAQNRQDATAETDQIHMDIRDAGITMTQVPDGIQVMLPDAQATNVSTPVEAHQVAMDYLAEQDRSADSQDSSQDAVIPTTNRIKPDPITGTGTKQLNEILFDVKEQLGINIHYRGAGSRAIGTYFFGSAATVIKYEGDLNTAAHEMAHNLDARFGIVAEWSGARKKSPFDAELRPFAEHGSISNSGRRAKLRYVRAEGVAEFVRAWMINPKAAEAAAPKFTKFFKNRIMTSDVGVGPNKKPLSAKARKAVGEKALKGMQDFGKQVRRFAGATGTEQTAANIRWTQLSKFQQMRKTMFGHHKGSGFQLTMWDRWSRTWLDSMRVMESAVNWVRDETGKNPLPENDPMVLARLLNGGVGVMEHIYKTGMIDSRGETVTGGGDKWLMSDLDDTNFESLQRDKRDAAHLGISERVFELWNRAQKRQKEAQKKEDKKAAKEGRKPKKVKSAKERLSGMGGGLVHDLDVANRTIKQLKADPVRYARLEKAVAKYREWADANLKFAVETGILSQKKYDEITAGNKFYINMTRVMEIKPGEDWVTSFQGNVDSANLGGSSQIIFEAEGSSKMVNDPWISLMESSSKIVKEGYRNNTMLALADLITTGKDMYDTPQSKMESVGRKLKAKDGAMQKVAIMRDGKREEWSFNTDVHKALMGMGSINGGIPVLNWPARMLRWGVTRMPAFAIRNVQRDLLSRINVTRSGTRQSLLETFDLRGNFDPTDLKRFGGDHSGYYLRDKVDWARAQRGTMLEIVKDKSSILVHPKELATFAAKGWRAYEGLLNKGEQFNRIAEYKAAFKKAKNELGYDTYNSHLHAANQARGLIDFAVAGDVARVLNQYIPFLNPAIQGGRRMARAITENPTMFLARFITFAVIPSVLVRHLARAGDYEEEYEQLPAYLRDLYWCIKIGDTWFKFPKAFEVGVMASGFERLWSQEILGEENALDGFTGSMLRTLLPVDETALGGPFKTLVGALMNYDSFRQKAIVPEYQKDVNLDVTKKDGSRVRNISHASSFSQAMQALAEKISIGPVKGNEWRLADARILDYIIKGTFGIAGDTALRASNTIMRREDTNKKLGTKDFGMTTDTIAWTAKDVQEVFDLASRNNIPTNSKTFGQLNAALKEYYDVDDADKPEKAIAAKKVRAVGSALRKMLESRLEKE
tara:strand:+ start:18491 stop:24214 length:5724 start_codon:yes stop_codon:yes gene_type:complete